MMCVRWMRSLVGQPVFAMAPRRIPCVVGGVAMIVALVAASFALAPLAGAATLSRQPNFGSNVYVFDPSMPLSQIQATVDAVANQQISNQFGTQRYALLFEPGTYGSSAAPLNFQVGYYTAVAGLGVSPSDVVINGSIDVYNQCFSGSCIALVNFWRSLSNVTINVTNPTFGCHTGEFWAVSQAAPLRRVLVNGLATFMDYCSGPSRRAGPDRPAAARTRRHRDQRFAAAVAGQEQPARWLVEWRLEPGVLGRHRCASSVFPRSIVVRWSVHYASDQPGNTGGAIPLRGLQWALQRVRARGPAQLRRHDMG